jgi:hypothetical protein
MYQVNHFVVAFITFLLLVVPRIDAAKKIGKPLVISPIDTQTSHSVSPMMKPRDSPRSKAPDHLLMVVKEKPTSKPNSKASLKPIKLTASPTLSLPTAKPSRMMNTLKPIGKPKPINIQSLRPAILSVPIQPIKVNKVPSLHISPITLPKIPKIPEFPKVP